MLTPKQKELYSGDWVDKQLHSDKNVTCFKCFTVYNLQDAPRTVPKSSGYYVKEPECPECRCRLYYS